MVRPRLYTALTEGLWICLYGSIVSTGATESRRGHADCASDETSTRIDIYGRVFLLHPA